MQFSIFLNSRKRTQYLYRLLQSIKQMTKNLDEIEVFVSADNDDELTKGFVEYLAPNWSFCEFYFIDRDTNLHRRLNNLLPQMSGEYLWILNDDTEIITENWDEIACNLLPDGYNSIIYGHTTCTSIDKVRNAQYSSFPMISRRAVDIMGHFITDKLTGLGGDVYLWRIFNKIDKIIHLPIIVRHILHETVKSVINCDIVAAEMRKNTQDKYIDCWNIDISNEIEKLQNEISTGFQHLRT